MKRNEPQHAIKQHKGQWWYCKLMLAKNGEGDKGAYLSKHEPLCSNEEQVKGKTKWTSFSKKVMYLTANLTFTKDFVILIKLKKIKHWLL